MRATCDGGIAEITGCSEMIGTGTVSSAIGGGDTAAMTRGTSGICAGG